MSANEMSVKILANALYEIRVLLGGFIGSDSAGPMEVRLAAHIAYALHNEALALADGKDFDRDAALRKIEGIDRILSIHEGARYAQAWLK